MSIKYYKKNVYGIDKNYLVECKQSKSILEITKQKTITNKQMELFSKLGIRFEEVLRSSITN